jgi:Flp pilus assembly protein TadD
MAEAAGGLQLERIDALLASDPDQVEPRYLRAGLLASLGRVEEAKQDYLAVIARAPTHFGALNDLATLLYNTDFRSAARLAYAEAVKHHPDNPIGRINLANALLADGQHAAAREQFEAALRLAPDHPDANQGMANLLQDRGEAEAAERLRQRSYRSRTVTYLPYRGEGPPCRLLLLMSASGGNVPTRFLLDDTVFATSILATEAHAPGAALPPHDLVFNAIGDADLCAAALDAAEAVLAHAAAPVVNPPARIRATGRAAIARNLADLPGVVTPKVLAVPREEVEQAARGFRYPLLLRSPGYHTGRNFLRVEAPGGLAAAAATLPGSELLLIEFLDARDAHGSAHKYRVMIIGGRLYPLHLAVSSDWKVHYFTADMADRPDHRAREAAFLDDMPGVLGVRAMAGLAAISQRLGLDYAGVDFALGPAGEVLLFEANATMVVSPPDSDPRWDYRRAPVMRILAAVRDMLVARAG